MKSRTGRNDDRVIDVCFICDNGYVMPTTVSIASLIRSRQVGVSLRVYVITADLSEDNAAIFRSLSSEGVEISVIKGSTETVKGLHTYSEKSFCVATPAALLKFTLAELLPDLDKVIYADGDVIFRKDVSDLYAMELGTNLVAAVADSGKMYSNRPILHAVKTYFNSGIMLLNLKLMREEGLAEKLITAKKNSTDASLMDQNIFNQVFDGRVIPLPIKFNCLFVNLVRAYENHAFTFRHLNNMFNTEYSDFMDLVEDAAIVHFSSKDKPWKVDNVPLVELWDRSYAESPFGGQALTRGRSEVGNGFDYHKRARRPYGELIVSLTTYSARIDVVHFAIESILAQTMKPDRIILWLAKEDFPRGDAELPENLKALLAEGLEIRWVDKNLRSHKKYFYVLQEFPSAAVITVDDDLLYPPNLVEQLYKSYERFPDCISALRTHQMTFSEDGSPNLYKKWLHVCADYVNFPSMRLFATTGAGVLYPPGIMPSATFKDDVFMSICPDADDVWMKMMSVAAGIRVVNPRHHKYDLKQIPGSQENALWMGNVLQNANDVQLEAVERYCLKTMPEGGSVVARIRDDVEGLEVQPGNLMPTWPMRDDVKPLVSVIVVMSNTSIYLDRCLKSLVQQSFRNIEIICVDDGSTDCPQDILRRHYNADGRISVYWQCRQGLPAAHRLGLAKARGEYVAFCRAEDFVSASFVEKLWAQLGSASPDIALCGHRVYNNAHRSVERLFAIPRGIVQAKQPISAVEVGAMFFDGLDPQLGAMLINRRFLAGIPDAFPEDFDCDLAASMILLSKAATIAVANESLYSRCPQLVRDRISRRDAFPGSLVDAFSAVRVQLERDGKFSELLPGYARVVIDKCVDRLLSFVTDVSFTVLYDALHGGGIQKMGLDRVMPADVGWPRFRMLRAIADYEEPLAFMKEIMLQKLDLEHHLHVASIGAVNAKKNAELAKAMQTDMGKLNQRIKQQEARIGEQVVMLRKLNSQAEASKRECSELKRSTAYRVGMFITWPLRKAYRGLFVRLKAKVINR